MIRASQGKINLVIASPPKILLFRRGGKNQSSSMEKGRGHHRDLS